MRFSLGAEWMPQLAGNQLPSIQIRMRNSGIAGSWVDCDTLPTQTSDWEGGMIHYHGGPITPDTCAIRAWKGRHAFISFAHAGQINLASEICQSFSLDNGAFTAWKAAGRNKIDWSDYYEFVARWKNHPGFDFAIIPDVIDGGEAENEALLDEWPHGDFYGVPVWHMN